MAQFRPGVPIVTKEPFVQVDAGLKPGVYTFRLVVVNDRRRASQPSDIRVIVRER